MCWPPAASGGARDCRHDPVKQPTTTGFLGGPVHCDEARASSCVGREHPYRLGRAFSLGPNRQYQYVYRRGKSYPEKNMVLIYLRAKTLRVGFSVSSKVGGSVTRNRIRRRMMEDFRLLRPSLISGKYIFVARGGAATAPAREMGEQMRRLLKRAKLLIEAEA